MPSVSENRPAQYLLLNNFGETGIGLFGRSLSRHLISRGKRVILFETKTKPLDFLRQLVTILATKRTLVANVGLTSWGDSPARNLLGFLSLSFRSEMGRPTILLLHNLIEVVDRQGTGFSVSGVTTLFAHLAIAGTRRATICVFSREIANALASSYRITVSRCAPLPCDAPVDLPVQPSDPPAIVCFGFLSPYKGVDLFLQACREIGSPCRLLIVGREHALLRKDPAYRALMERVQDLAQQVNAEMLGFVSDSTLMEVLKPCYVGVLPYTSTTGSSASFTQLATAGVPVVASKLPEFEFLAREGAGMVLVAPNPAEIAASVRKLLQDPTLRSKLALMQTSYAAMHSWPKLCDWIESQE